VLRRILSIIEIAILSAVIVATRCANFPEVFVGGNVYFTDADCYGRMTRVRMITAEPGLLVRHHTFENFPLGTTPHTTAPLDYLIFGLSMLIVAARPALASYQLDLAGALISPLLALIGGWFLWWWSRRMRFRYRWVMLILYAISPILVHGTELGRPDHQSLLILLVTIGICAEWTLRTLQTTQAPADAIRESRIARRVRAWCAISAAAWAIAMWVSLYEPLVLFLLVTGTTFFVNRQSLFARDRRAGWILFAALVAVAVVIERRIPSFVIFGSNAIFKNWAGTIGELAQVSLANPAWLRWCGFLLLVTPLLIWISMSMSRKATPWFVLVLLVTTFGLTIWQARWGYFFVLVFALALPALLAPIKSGVAVSIAFVLSMYPILREWDERFWPNETQLASRVEKRIESAQIRQLALGLRSSDLHPFLAPWWLSPSIAYWSEQPGVTGSSHESLGGIEDSARFFLSEDLQQAREILEHHRVAWVFAYDSERVAQNSAAILKEPVPQNPLCRVLDRTPSHAPRFLIFSARTESAKVYRASVEP
jgi:hypothetical protein